ncbi:MAG: transketolase [Clostridia bacterium]|nr:transketolase [Clostridia bacterium]
MNIDQKCINTARVIAAETISNANSGHTGSSLGAAAILYTLFKDHLIFSTNDDLFLNRDRFVLSVGHICPLLYTLENMFGFPISIESLKAYRKYESKTPGHPHYGLTPGIEASTGPLGQGIANAVGMAIAESMLAERFNVLDDPIFSNYTYVLAGDGCLMEGVALEAISLAGNLKLNKLILLYDYNQVTIDGRLSISNTEDVKAKFEAQNWNVIIVQNGNNYKAISKAIENAKKSKDKPTIIIFKTIIGYGSKFADNPCIHGKALDEVGLADLKRNLEIYSDSFEIPEDVRKHCLETTKENKEIEMNWRRKVNLYSKTNPELYKQLALYIENKQIDVEKIVGNKIKDKKISGRNANNIILNILADKFPNIIGGAADVASSTKTIIEGDGIFGEKNRRGRNIAFGVREHAMSAIANGISLYSGFKVFVSTYLVFSSYLLPALRMSAMMKQPILYFFTHDSLLIGEDGETHQPIEQLGCLRQIPDINVCRPCDAKELMACYNLALNTDKPTCFILSKQELTEQKSEVEKAMKGAYVLEKDDGAPDIVFYATGSEIELAVSLKKELNKEGTKVAIVSFPCIEEFERQTEQYKNSVLFKDVKTRIAIEASADTVWYKYIGDYGKVINVTRFGASGRGIEVYKKYGFSVSSIRKEITKILK